MHVTLIQRSCVAHTLVAPPAHTITRSKPPRERTLADHIVEVHSAEHDRSPTPVKGTQVRHVKFIRGQSAHSIGGECARRGKRCREYVVPLSRSELDGEQTCLSYVGGGGNSNMWARGKQPNGSMSRLVRGLNNVREFRVLQPRHCLVEQHPCR